MDERTVTYYDRASDVYSAVRYPKKSVSYIHYIFKKRRDIFLDMMREIEPHLPKDATILEVGCADGILFAMLEKHFPGRFKKMVGIDISPKMIEVARQANTNPRAEFLLRDELPEETFDLVIELGVHPYDLQKELAYVFDRLRGGGYFLYSVVAAGSLYRRMKIGNADYAKDYRTYKGYEEFFKHYFSIVRSEVYGFFVPKLWAAPLIARRLQPIIDSLFGGLTPELFHERIYLLRSSTRVPRG